MAGTRGRTGSHEVAIGYLCLFAVYFLGLLLWLSLGILPLLAAHLGTVRGGLHGLAGGDTWVSGIAREALHAARTPPSVGWVAVQYLFSLLNLGLGVLLTWVRPRERVPRLLALAFIGTAGTFNEPSHEVFHLLVHAPVVTAVHFSFHIVSGSAYLWAVVLFPDGRWPWRPRGLARRVVPVAAFLGTVLIVWICYRSSFIAHPPFFVVFFGVLVSVVGLVVQSIRLRAGERGTPAWQQARLLRVALAPALLLAVTWMLAQAWAVLARLVGASATSRGAEAAALLAQQWFPAVFALVPVMLAVAILRYRLWDIDLIVSRGLLFGMLAGFVAVVYGGVLLLTGRAFAGDTWPGVMAMTVVALAIEPVRARCRAVANKIVFGQRLTPREALTAMARHLSQAGGGDDLLELVRVVVAGTRAAEAQLWLVEARRLHLASAAPEDRIGDRPSIPVAEPSLQACASALRGMRCEPVRHDGELVAVLALSMPSGLRLPREEAGLVRELADHAGLLVVNARLSRALAARLALINGQAAELARSRRRVVAAQDEARRHLERDLHDGAQQELVAALIRLRTLLDVATDQAVPTRSLEEVRLGVAHTRTSIASLCRGSRPERLALLGLRQALEEAATLVRRGGVVVEVRCHLPRALPPDVEAAIYFCCVEALQNIAKHARARHVLTEVAVLDAEARFSVRDDGVGFDPTATLGGTGMTNLAERVADLGGTLHIEARVPHGARLVGTVPLPDAPPVSAGSHRVVAS